MLIIALFFIVLAFVALFAALGLFGKNESEAAKRLTSLYDEEEFDDGSTSLIATREYGFAQKYTPAGAVMKAERNVMLAGRPENWSVARVLSSKVIFAGFGLAFGLVNFLNGPSLISGAILIVATVIGYVAPDKIIESMARARQDEIQKELPDMLDQVTISIESGTSFESALARIGQSTEGPLPDEIVRTVQDIALGVPRREAYQALADRTDVEDMRKMTRAVTQGEEYGIPMSEIVRNLAAEMRTSRRLRAEEKANRIPVMMLLPLVFCIIPVLFVVILTPVVLNVIETL